MVRVVCLVMPPGGGPNTSESKRRLLERLNAKFAMKTLVVVTGGN